MDFKFNCYDEDIVICGSKGSGKTYLANQILNSLKGVNVWVYDFNYQFSDPLAYTWHNLPEMLESYSYNKYGHYIFRPFDKSENTFSKFCAAAFNIGNLVVILDELHQYVTKQKILKSFNEIILSGRPRGISVISISTRPASLPNIVLTNAEHVFTFRLNLESDIKFLESYVGSDVWQLLPKDKRNKMQELDELPPHSCIYRKMSSPTSEIITP